jgi:hypothetical protein
MTRLLTRYALKSQWLSSITADKMYDTNAVYQKLEKHFPDADIIIPPKDNTFADDYHHSKRMSNLIECFAAGIMNWQKCRNYGRRNVSETAMQRYKKILGNKLHSRNFSNQNQEMLLGCSILNRFTHLELPDHIQRQVRLSIATKPLW